jgi:hypothetical protein
MTNLLIAIVGIFVVALTLRAGLLLIRLYTLRYEAYREHANAFYEAADRLIDNPNTPDDVVNFIGEMNGTINFPDAAMAFTMIFRRNRSKQHSKPKGSPRFNLRTMPQDVVADFVIAFEHWIEAMAYRGMAWGPIFKAHLDAPTVEAKAKSVAAQSDQRTIAMAAT